MYTNTRFGELLKVLPKNTFKRCVEQHRSDKHNKGFDSWGQLISLMYAQLSGCRSLRELEVSYNSHSAHHYHLGCGPISARLYRMPIANEMPGYLNHSASS